jgi:hypothetical protein
VALIVEDGTAKADAQTYVSTAEVTAYASLYGLSATGLTEGHIMQAMRYIEGAYFGRWVGVKYSEAQALQWPRSFAERQDGWSIYQNEIPKELKDAVSALAIRAINSDLNPDITRNSAAIEEEVGPIRVKYANYAPVVTVFRDVELILRNIVSPMRAGKVVRT